MFESVRQFREPTLRGKLIFTNLTNMEVMTGQIVEKISRLATKLRGENVEIGISIPGITDQTLGKVLFVPYFNWYNWDICKVIKKETGLCVTVENDANA